MSDQTISEFVKKNKTILIIIMIGLLLVELEIFALATMKSGRKSWLQIMDSNGEVIHETDGNNLSEFNRYYFERTFGPLKNYEVRLKIQEKPFPFRAWFVATLGVPVGAVLLFGFIFKSYLSLFRKEDAIYHFDSEIGSTSNNESKIDIVLNRISRMNIFITGGIVFTVVISYWIVPDTINYIGKVGIDTVAKFKWFLILITVLVTSVGMWIIYLRYRLAKTSIESRVKIEKYKLQLKHDPDDYFPKLEIDTVNKD